MAKTLASVKVPGKLGRCGFKRNLVLRQINFQWLAVSVENSRGPKHTAVEWFPHHMEDAALANFVSRAENMLGRKL